MDSVVVSRVCLSVVVAGMVSLSLGPAVMAQPSGTQNNCPGAFCTDSRSVPHYLFSMPSTSSIASAEELLASVPNALHVSKYYPESVGAACNGYRWDGSTCVPLDDKDDLLAFGSGTCPTIPHPGASGCSSSCFCVKEGDGFLVQFNANGGREFNQFGTVGGITLLDLQPSEDYLISLPLNTLITTAQQILNAIPQASSVQRFTENSQLVSWAGVGSNFTVLQGEAYIITSGGTGTATIAAGTTPIQPCVSNRYDITGSSTGAAYSWAIDEDGVFPPREHGVGTTSLPALSTAANFASQFVDEINVTSSAQLVPGAPTQFCVNSDHPSLLAPDLHVGAAGFVGMTLIGVTPVPFNPDIKKIGGAPDATPIDFASRTLIILWIIVMLGSGIYFCFFSRPS